MLKSADWGVESDRDMFVRVWDFKERMWSVIFISFFFHLQKKTNNYIDR